MARSVAFLQWMCSRTNWNLIPHSEVMVYLYALLVSLLWIFKSSSIFLFLRCCMMLLYTRRWCLSALVLSGSAKIALESQWYTIIMYWLPLHDRTGTRPVSSVYNLDWGSTLICSSWLGLLPLSTGSLIAGDGGDLGSLGFVYWTFCLVCAICPFRVSTDTWQYQVAFWYVRPYHNL